jgi:serine/threonine protein kinase/Tol biopolymer transport system component
MGLNSGTRLGAYEIVALLGAGGMGEVYRAKDTRLKREVAIKVLPDAFANDPERLARFQREAELLATLNHPNIAQIHGLEDRALVLELVDGPTLADRITQGAIPIDEALAIAKQIAEALEAAHERGVIHRDLKPSNIKVTPNGKVKVLDFGLAKAISADASTPSNLSMSPTITSPAMTLGGVILGTAAYMSPEQARGKAVDKRADIWAFGCVLYEMLTGRGAFEGDDVSDTLAAILRADPAWQLLPETVPPSVVRLLHRCLAKDRQRRLADIADAILDLHDAQAEGVVPPQRDRIRPPRATPWIAATIAATIIAAVAVAVGIRRPPTAPAFRTSLVMGVATAEGPGLSGIAISPDGTRVVYRGSTQMGGTSQLFLRQLDRYAVTPIRGTERGTSPFFSPDGAWLAFIAEGKLKKVELSGATPIVICDAPGAGHGGTWSSSDTILFAASGNLGLMKVSAGGGVPELVTHSDPKRERLHRWPTFLRDGKTFVFVDVPNSNFEESTIYARSLDTGQQVEVTKGGTRPRILPTDHLILARSASLVALPLSPRWPHRAGVATGVDEARLTMTPNGVAQYDVSNNGVLVYVPAQQSEINRTLAWVDRRGNVSEIPGLRQPINGIAVAPDGKRVALSLNDQNRDIWIYEFDRGALQRLTSGPGVESNPLWTADGRRVAYSVNNSQIFWKPIDASAPEQLLLKGDTPGSFPQSWTKDGRQLVYQRGIGQGFNDLWALPLDGDRQPKPVIETPFDEIGAALSPDSKWIAYQSNESGRGEIYIRPFTASGGRLQVSVDGGTFAAWSPNGRELFFRSGDRMMASAISTTSALTAAPPQFLFSWPLDGRFSVAPDGKRFLMVKGEAVSSAHLNLVVNFFSEVRQRAK